VASYSLARVGRAAGIAGFTLLFATQTVAAATPPRALATTSNPYASCTIGSGPPEWGTVNATGAEVEPWVAVNPTNRRNILGVVQQDRWNDGGAHGLVAMYSRDGGSTFHVVPLPFSSCAPGGLAYERASDPWVSFGPDGTAYAAALSFDENSPRNAVTAATSTDGGKTWGNVREIIVDTDATYFHDKESVTADPTTAGTAYIVWDRTPWCCDYPAPSMMSKTTDFGVSWSAPQLITPVNNNTGDLGNVMVVDPNTGTLYDFLDRFYNTTSGTIRKYLVIKSTDGGANWSSPVVVATDKGIDDYDPHPGGGYLRTGVAIVSAAIDRTTGRLYVVWEDARFTGGAHNQVLISTSPDGTSWSKPAVVSTTIGQTAFTPAVAVNDDGQVAVTYFDFRSYDSGKSRLPTSYWMRISPPRGKAFGPDIALLPDTFNILNAPDAGGLFLGDYMGLAARGSSFVALYCTTTPHPDNKTDCFASKVKAP
jgi:hypothetical protein